MKRISTISVSVFLFLASTMMAQIDLNTGVTGSYTGPNQSYNETRGVDVTVVSPNDILLTGMRLDVFNVGGDGMALTGARIYSTATHALLYHLDTTVYSIYQGVVNFQISYILKHDSTYTVSLFCGGTNSDNSAQMFQPISNGYPYTESLGLLKVLEAHAVGADAFPANHNIYVPRMKLYYDNTFATGISSNINSPAIILYPNPASSVINIHQSIEASNQQITITDVLGNEVYKDTLIGMDHSIAISNWNNGIYFYVIKGENETVRGKFVVSK